MKVHPLRRWLVATAIAGLSITTIVITQAGGGVAGAVGTDSIQYVQAPTGSSFQFVPGDGSTPTVQSLNFNGTCKTPSFSPSPLLALGASAWLSPVNGVPYTGPVTAESVGTNQARTGVCEKSPGWSISENQSMTFALGANPLVSARTLTEGKFPIQMNGADNSGNDNTVTLTMIERSGTTVVGTQSLVITGTNGTTVTADTGPIATGFSSVELRITHPNIVNGKQSNVSIIGTTTFLLQRFPQTITFTNTPPPAPVVNDSYTVTATGGASGNPVTFSVDPSSTSGCHVNAQGLVSLLGPAGLCVIDANQAGNATYAPAPQAQQPVTVGLAPQTITFTSTPPPTPVAGDQYTVTATGGPSGNPVTFSIDGTSTSGCTIVGNVVTFSPPPGSCIIDANQAGNSSYAAAPQASQPTTEFQTICGQQTIQTQSTDGTTGQVSARFTFLDFNGAPAPTSVCKTYSLFSATANSQVPGLTGNQTVTFDSNPLATAHMTATISWAPQAFCTPDGSNNTPQCPPTSVSFDGGGTWQVQTYCTSAQAAGVEWCTTNRSYTITAQGTQITETWDGYGDPLFHHN